MSGGVSAACPYCGTHNHVPRSLLSDQAGALDVVSCLFTDDGTGCGKPFVVKIKWTPTVEVFALVESPPGEPA